MAKKEVNGNLPKFSKLKITGNTSTHINWTLEVISW